MTNENVTHEDALNAVRKVLVKVAEEAEGSQYPENYASAIKMLAEAYDEIRSEW